MTMDPSENSSLNQQDVVFTKLEGEGVLLHLKTKYYYTTNETATRIIELLEEGKDTESIVSQLCLEYDVDRDTCLTDVRALLKQLNRESLITS